MKRIAIAVVTLVLGISSAQADFTQGLLARWTFNDTSAEAKALTDDVGGLVLKRGGIGRDQEFKLEADGSVLLGSGVFLAAAAVNSASEKFRGLADGGTVWCRIKYLDFPESTPTFNFGLENSLKPANWVELILTQFYTPKGIGVRAKGPEKLEAGMASGHLPFNKDGYSNMAVVFDGKTKKLRLFVDGKSAERNAPMTKLDAFQCLMLGRLKESSGQRVQIDEIRVYSTPLSAEWIDEIEPVASK